MSWTLREGVSLHPMPFGGAFVLDDARLAARQISSELATMLAGPTTAPAGPGGAATVPAGSGGAVTASVGAGGAATAPVGSGGAAAPAGSSGAGGAPSRAGGARTGLGGAPPTLAAELRLGLDEGCWSHREETG